MSLGAFRLAACALAGAVVLSACSTTPPPPPADPAPTGPLVRLVVKPLRAASEELTKNALQLDGATCSAASLRKAYEVICPADLSAAAEVMRMRDATGGCDDNDDCTDALTKLSEGDEYLFGELSGAPGAYLLTLDRVGKDGVRVKRATREAMSLPALEQQLVEQVREVLAR